MIQIRNDMLKLGIFVGENNWAFFHEIYEDLSIHYSTDVFKPRTYYVPLLHGRVNEWAFQHGIRYMLNNRDVCFFEWASNLLATASHLPKKAKIVTRLHSFEIYDWAPHINWKNVDWIIVLSQAMGRMFADLYPEHAEKLVIIRNGCSLDKFCFFPKREFTFTLGMLSAITPIKRTYEVVLILDALIKKGYPAVLRIAGAPEGDERYVTAIYKLVEKLGLENRIIFDGFVLDTPAWLKNVDIFISNSYWEGQQTALIEAMASGCYCLAHCWNGADEMLPSDNIYLHDNELLEKIAAYAQLNTEQQFDLQVLMRSTAEERFDINSVKENIIGLIEAELHTRLEP